MANIVRKVDDLGRIVIPMEMRRTLGIKPGDQLEIIGSDEDVRLVPYRTEVCQHCGAAKRCA